MDDSSIQVETPAAADAAIPDDSTTRGVGEEGIHTTESADSSNTASDDWEIDVPLGGQTFHVSINAEQRVRLGMIIAPKPVPTDFDRGAVNDAHRQSVQNVGLCLIHRIAAALDRHDAKKLDQTSEEHQTTEEHHWPLEGYTPPDDYLPLQYVVEAAADYIATVFGRALAGRDVGWMPPTSRYTAGDALTSTFLDFLSYYELATVTPPLESLKGKDI